MGGVLVGEGNDFMAISIIGSHYCYAFFADFLNVTHEGADLSFGSEAHAV